MSITSWGPNTEKTVADFEQEIGFSLPDDYRRFLLDNNGALAKRKYFSVNDLDQDVMLDVFFGITNESDSLTLNYWLQEYGEEIDEQSLLIGSDPGGRFLLYVTTGEEKGIYYWDDTHFFPQSRGEEGDTYFMAHSFAEFYELLKDYVPA